MNIYLEAFSIFFKIGAFTIGGGYAMVPLIENEIVTKRNWIAKDDFIDLLAISQSSPGILAVNISIFIGYRLRGIRGSIVTALGTILPSFLIILATHLQGHPSGRRSAHRRAHVQHGQVGTHQPLQPVDTRCVGPAHLAPGFLAHLDHHCCRRRRILLWKVESQARERKHSFIKQTKI